MKKIPMDKRYFLITWVFSLSVDFLIKINPDNKNKAITDSQQIIIIVSIN
jgi:hypothetical protein